MTAGPNGSEEETNESVKGNTYGRNQRTHERRGGGNPNPIRKNIARGESGGGCGGDLCRIKEEPNIGDGQTDSLPAIQLMTEQVGGSEEHGRRRPRAREMGSSVLNHFQYRYRILQPFEGDRQTPRAQRPLALSPPPRNFRVPLFNAPSALNGKNSRSHRRI